MAGEMSGNGWDQWKLYVLESLKDNKNEHKANSDDHKCIVQKLDQIQQTIVALQIKSGVWGLLGGLIPVLIVVILWALRNSPTSN